MQYRLACLALVATALFAGACGQTPVYEDGPPEYGGYDPGGEPGTESGYGLGYPDGGGAAGGGAPPPPDCDDELKQCAHDFSFPNGGEASVELRGSFKPDGWTSGVPLTLEGSSWKASVLVPWDVEVQYKFVIDGTTWVTDPANQAVVPDGAGGQNSLLAGFTCVDFSCVPPLLGYDWRDAVLYFVLVDRFKNGNPSNDGPAIAGVQPAAGYQGGDFEGVTQTIESGYFEELGVNTLWLSVPFDNTDAAGVGDDGMSYSAYHGYWPKDLALTESRQGSLAELEALVDAAHAHGLKVIVDYAMNHVHISSPVYQQHQEWFWPLSFDNKTCVCGGGCGWDGSDGKRCWFRDYLPDFNFTNAEARAFSVDNAMGWISSTGIDGLRLDAVKHIEDSWLLDLRARVKAEIEPVTNQHFYMVGETFTGDKATIQYYVNPSTMLDGQFDFPLRASLVASLLTRQSPMTELDSFLVANDGYYGAGVMSTFVGNHDVPRAIHFAQDQPLWGDVWAGGKDRAWQNQPALPGGMSAFERLGNAFTLLFTLPGVPLIYYGDEVGMPGAGDPDNRRFMQWSGYSAGQVFLKTHLQSLAAIRAAHPALRRGTRETLAATSDTLVYRMQDGADVVFVAVNRADSSRTVGGLPSASLQDELDLSTHTGPELELPARSARILLSQ